MVISDVRVKLIEDANDRLKAVCSVTFDGEFVVRDVKVVDGTHGLFVAMPSRKLSVHCPQCRQKNHLRAKFCNECGGKLAAHKPSTDTNGRVRLHRDIAHPINPSFREMMQTRVIQSFQTELGAAQQPGYKPAELEEEEEIAPETVIEVTEEMTEYDALIAGLGTGAGASPRPAPSRGPAPRPAPQPAQHSDTRRTESRPPRPQGRPPEPRRDRPAPPPPRPARESSFTDDYPLGPPPTFDDVPPPAPPYVEAREESPAPPPQPAVTREPRRTEAPAASRPPTPQPKSNEDAPFGQGIL